MGRVRRRRETEKEEEMKSISKNKRYKDNTVIDKILWLLRTLPLRKSWQASNVIVIVIEFLSIITSPTLH